MPAERRHTPRATIALHLKVDGVATAVTRDLSAGGLYLFITPSHHLVGPLELELDLPRAGLRACARCDVVRVEHGLWQTGVALRVRDISLKPLADLRPGRLRRA